jgi:hypothetical protein
MIVSRQRVTIPIRDERGRVVGFGSRMLPGDSDGESSVEAEDRGASNTPQTPILIRAPSCSRSTGRRSIFVAQTWQS